MIRLASRVFRITVSHTGSDGGTIYMINHDLGTQQVHAELYFQEHKTPVTDYFFNGGSQNYGFILRDTAYNYAEFNVFRWWPAGPAGTKQFITSDLEIVLRAAQ